MDSAAPSFSSVRVMFGPATSLLSKKSLVVSFADTLVFSSAAAPVAAIDSVSDPPSFSSVRVMFRPATIFPFRNPVLESFGDTLTSLPSTSAPAEIPSSLSLSAADMKPATDVVAAS